MSPLDRTLTCQECQDQLSGLIDGALPVEEIEGVRRHTAACKACAAECADLLCVNALARAANCPAVPPDLWDRVRQAVDRSGPSLPAPLREVLTLQEAAEYLRLSEDALMRALGEVPHFVVGRQVRFRRRTLDDWIERQEHGLDSARDIRRFSVGGSRGLAGTTGADVIDFNAARTRLSRMGLIGDRTGVKGRIER